MGGLLQRTNHLLDERDQIVRHLAGLISPCVLKHGLLRRRQCTRNAAVIDVVVNFYANQDSLQELIVLVLTLYHCVDTLKVDEAILILYGHLVLHHVGVLSRTWYARAPTSAAKHKQPLNRHISGPLNVDIERPDRCVDRRTEIIAAVILRQCSIGQWAEGALDFHIESRRHSRRARRAQQIRSSTSRNLKCHCVVTRRIQNRIRQAQETRQPVLGKIDRQRYVVGRGRRRNRVLRRRRTALVGGNFIQSTTG